MYNVGPFNTGAGNVSASKTIYQRQTRLRIALQCNFN